jgi:hypothetical protein
LIYLKSILCGLAAVFVAAVATAVAIIITLAIKSRNVPPGESYGWDPVSLFRGSLVSWFILALVFAIGFAWEYRHAVSHR